MGVAIAPLDDPDLAMAELEFALESGLEAVWVPHRPSGDRSPGHVDLDPFWARLAESGTPFVLHVGGAPLQLAKAWMNNGRAPTKDWMGGGENLRTKDIALLHEGPEAFLTMMVLDGVLERHPTLRGASVELGAGAGSRAAAPARLGGEDLGPHRRQPARGWSRTPSQQITEQLAFRALCVRGGGRPDRPIQPNLHLFSTDYPHVEGGRNPLGRFESSLGERSETVQDKFYAENFLRIFPKARVSAGSGDGLRDVERRWSHRTRDLLMTLRWLGLAPIRDGRCAGACHDDSDGRARQSLRRQVESAIRRP